MKSMKIPTVHFKNLWKMFGDGMLLLHTIRIIAAYFRLVTTHFEKNARLF